jgi:gamma-butyrobetaine dioxygenase
LKQSKTGGESTFIDGFQIASELKKIDPDAFKILSQVKVTFWKNDSHRQYYFRRETFQVDDQNNLISIYYSPPFEGPLKIENHLVEPFYEAFQKYSKVISFIFKIIFEMLNDKKNIFEYKMKPGEMVVFNNRRILHGRNSFGANEERVLEGCYFDSDEFCNKYLTLKRKLKKDGVLRPCGSYSHIGE